MLISISIGAPSGHHGGTPRDITEHHGTPRDTTRTPRETTLGYHGGTPRDTIGTTRDTTAGYP
eukprot:2321271-Pyramimonas_sp.AAC.1